jgi:hypothetical protein
MTIVITSRESESGVPEILVAGHLSGEAVPALEQAMRDTPDARLNLAELRGMDEEGEALLRRLRQEGASLTRLSPFVSLLLGNDTDPS